jgi:C-terminal processing protease CtpA/Prc
MRWRHIGLRHGDRNVYRSTREKFPSSISGEGRNVYTRDTLFIRPLAPRIVGVVPLAVFADSSGTLPRGETFHVPNAEAPLLNRSTRLAIVALAWLPVQHSYPYFDVIYTDWSAALKAAVKKAAIDDGEYEFTVTLRRMMADLHDGHASVISPIAPFLGAPGVEWGWVEDQVVVTQVHDPSLASIAPGDRLTAVDQRPVSEVLVEKIAERSGATHQWRSFRAVRELAVGRKESAAHLEFEPFGRPAERYTIVAERNFPVTPLPVRKQPDQITEIVPGIMYVDLGRITNADFVAALPTLERVGSIVFDMRAYPAGWDIINFLCHLSETTMHSSQRFLPHITRPDREGFVFARSGESVIEPRLPFLKARKVFITDGRAVSVAESLLSVVENYRLGEIVGGATAGTNGNINRIPLLAGFSVTFTGMKVLKHDGSRHHGVGILPTIPMAPTRAGIAAGRDELLDEAIAVAKRGEKQ